MVGRTTSDALAALSQFTDRAADLCRECFVIAAPYWQAAATFLSNPWARAIGLTIIVYLTIRVIASVYSGDKQNSEMGPVALRPHAGKRLGRDGLMLPHSLMGMTMDGVSASCRVFYVYRDAQGKRRRREVYYQRDMRLAISPVRLRPIGTAQFGYEIPEVASEDVCFPPVELEQTPSPAPATPPTAQEYAALHKIIEGWTEDDEAPLISFEENVLEEIADNRRSFIVDSANRVKRWREASFLTRWLQGNVAKTRPNVVGSYYVKLEFSHEPIFVLTRHPDRDLKMTAWLTVLTSMFALVMDAWPKAPPMDMAERPRPAHESTIRTPRVPAP
jgi:hypothetical protein